MATRSQLNLFNWDFVEEMPDIQRIRLVLDNVFGLEWHTIRGLAMTRLRVGLALSAMLAMALGRMRNGQAGLLPSMVKPAA